MKVLHEITVQLFNTRETKQRGRWMGVFTFQAEVEQDEPVELAMLRALVSDWGGPRAIADTPDGFAFVITEPPHQNGFPVMFVTKGGELI